MQRKMKWSGPVLMLLAIGLSMTLLSSIGVPTSRAQTSSAASSTPSATPAASPTPDPDAGLRQACSDAITELVAARKLIASQQTQLQRDAELQGMQDQLTTGLKNLRTLDAEEKQNLRDAVAAATRETAAVRAENAVLKKQKMTFFKRLKYIAIGVGVGVVAGAVLVKR